MAGIFGAAAAGASTLLNAGIGVASGFIVKGATENPDWTAFGIFLAMPLVCCIGQFFFWRWRSQKMAGEGAECEFLCVAPACCFAPVGFFVGFLVTYLRLHFAPGINGMSY